MKLYKATAVGIVIGALITVIGYTLWQQRQPKAPADAGSDAAVKTVMPPNHPGGGAVSMPGEVGKRIFGNAALVHFQVGNRNVKSIYADRNAVWIGTSGGVIRYDPVADSHQTYNNKTAGILSNGVFHVSRIGDKIAVGTYGGGLSLLDEKTRKWSNINIPQGLADQFVYDVHQARNGDIWIATWSGANRVRGGNFEDASRWATYTVENTRGGLPNPWVYALAEAPNGDMWFATEAGLARFSNGVWQHWQHIDGLGAPYEEVKDDIAFTSDPAKASQHHAQQKMEQGLQGINVAYNPNYIISLAVDRHGVVWCGTWGGGLARFDGKTWKNFTARDGLPANHVFMLYVDPQDHLWIGTNHGLARLNDDGKGFTTLTSADGLYADNVFSMATAADGSVWIGSLGGVAHIAPAH